MLVHTQIKRILPHVRIALVGRGVGLERRNVMIAQSVYQDIKYVLTVQLLMIDSARSALQGLTKEAIILLPVLPVQLAQHGAQLEPTVVLIVWSANQVTTKA